MAGCRDEVVRPDHAIVPINFLSILGARYKLQGYELQLVRRTGLPSGEVFFNGLKPEGIPNRTDTVEDDSSDKRRACFGRDLIVPTLCVGMHPVTLCVIFQKRNAERPWRRSHAGAWERSTEGQVDWGDRSHALRGNASRDALRHLSEAKRGASLAAFPRGSVGTIKKVAQPSGSKRPRHRASLALYCTFAKSPFNATPAMIAPA
ncbi:hypothetical protein J2W43_005276 [Pseudomonas brassicacearum]|uniref:Uncharacterized protein n=1 Tax=Pseudomonas brassicacearum TaxID=930166 RepID=A0AAW8MHY3_9PSED|nr:hypothetical protein [Pseudomonas brassicacearum]